MNENSTTKKINHKSGFLKGSYIDQNITTIMDIIHFTTEENIPALVIAVDFGKNDTVEWLFMYRCLENFHLIFNWFLDWTSKCPFRISECSLKIHFDKKEVMRIGSIKHSSCTIKTHPMLKWTTDVVKTLGISLTRDPPEVLRYNICPAFETIQNIIKMWFSRKLTLFRKITVIKTLMKFQLIYKLSVLPTPSDQFLKQIDQTLFNFVWIINHIESLSRWPLNPSHRWIPGQFQRPVTRSFDAFFDLRMNKRLSKQSLGWWFETTSQSLWRHCNGNCSSTAFSKIVPVSLIHVSSILLNVYHTVEMFHSLHLLLHSLWCVE